MRLLLVRHGETVWNAARRLQGAVDVPLSELGRKQASQLASSLRNKKIDVIYSSDLVRAHETAEILNRTLNAPIRLDPRLREQAKGIWEGLTWTEIEAQYAIEVKRWQANRDDPPEGAEGVSMVAKRIQAAFSDIRAAHHKDDCALVVSHGMALRTLICVALGIDPVFNFQFQLGNTGLTELDCASEFGNTLVQLNNLSHLT